MDRIEPTAGPDLLGLTFRRTPRWAEPATDSRFALGVAIFLLVALVYPWYSYRVQAHLLARDMQEGVEALTESVDRETGLAQAQVASVAQESAADARRRRLSQVRVTGTSEGNPPLVVVQLGEANMLEASEPICRQAERWLRRSLSGRMIRVQGIRTSGRAGSITQLACP